MNRLLIATAIVVLGASSVQAQALDAAQGKPLAELLNEGYSVLSTTNNGRTGELVLTVRKDAKHAVCVLSEIRGSGYTDPKPKPVALPCIPLN